MSKLVKNVKQQIRPDQVAKQEIRSQTTAKTETKTEPTQDFFGIYKQNIDKYFEHVENSIPKYYQTVHELQQEYVQAWENMFNATITVQKEFIGKTGMDTEQSAAASKFVSDATESAIKARKVRDEIILSSIDTAKENLKEWNKQYQGFADMNRKIAQSWISVFAARKN